MFLWSVKQGVREGESEMRLKKVILLVKRFSDGKLVSSVAMTRFCKILLNTRIVSIQLFDELLKEIIIK